MPPGPEARRLCALADIQDGSARGFDPDSTGRDTMFIVRRGAALVAYRDECPHYPGAVMAWRRHAYLDAFGTSIACHGHGALFDIATGRCVSGPCVGSWLERVAISCTPDGDVCIDATAE